MFENTYKNIFPSLVNALDYDLIIFFIEKGQVPTSTFRFKHLEKEQIVSEKSAINLMCS